MFSSFRKFSFEFVFSNTSSLRGWGVLEAGFVIPLLVFSVGKEVQEVSSEGVGGNFYSGAFSGDIDVSYGGLNLDHVLRAL